MRTDARRNIIAVVTTTVVLLAAYPATIKAQPFCVDTIGDIVADDYAILASLLNATGLYGSSNAYSKQVPLSHFSTDALNSSFTLFAPTNTTRTWNVYCHHCDAPSHSAQHADCPQDRPRRSDVAPRSPCPQVDPDLPRCAQRHQSRASEDVTTVVTVAGPAVTVNNNPAVSSSLSVAAAESTAKILDPQVPGQPAVFADKNCSVYVYPIDTVLLPPGATAILGTLSGVKP